MFTIKFTLNFFLPPFSPALLPVPLHIAPHNLLRKFIAPTVGIRRKPLISQWIFQPVNINTVTIIYINRIYHLNIFYFFQQMTQEQRNNLKKQLFPCPISAYEIFILPYTVWSSASCSTSVTLRPVSSAISCTFMIGTSYCTVPPDVYDKK